jgi:hypothetical protein
VNHHIHSYLLHHALISKQQLVRAEELTGLWQGTLPVVLLKLGWIDYATFAFLFELQPST